MKFIRCQSSTHNMCQTSCCTCHSISSLWRCGNDTFRLAAILHRTHGRCPAWC